MNGESDPRTHVPSLSGAMFLWQYEFEQSLMNQQVQYQQQAKAMEVSIKEAAQQAASRAAEVGKLLGQENDASTVDVIEELSSSSRRSKSIPASPISREKKGYEKGSHRSRSQGTSDMRTRRSEEGRKKEGSASRSWERRRRHRSRSRSMERRRRHRCRSRSRESRRQHRSRSRTGEKQTHEKRRSRSRTRKKSEESCRSSENKRRRESDISRSPRKGHNRENFSFPGSPDSRSISSHNGSKQRMKSKTVDKTKVVKGMGKLSRKSIWSEHFGGGESEGRAEEALQKMIAGVQDSKKLTMKLNEEKSW